MTTGRDEWEEVLEDSIDEPNSVVTTDSVGFNSLESFAPATSLDLENAPPLNYEEAKVLTEHIRATADVLYVLIQRAHAGRAWEALGYNSFESYVKTEFSISRSRAYQLLNQAKVVAEITAAAPEGTKIEISEAAARDLKSLISEIVPDIATRTEGLSPDDAGLAIEDMIREYRDRKNEDADDIGEEEEQRSYSGGNGEFYKNNDVVSDATNDDDNDDDLDALLRFDEDPRETRQKFESVYNLYSSLAALKDMPDVDKMISWMPVERRVQVSAALPQTVAWLTEFFEKWKAQPWAQGADVEDEEEENEDFTSDQDDIFNESNIQD